MLVNHLKGALALCHNGNLVNARELREELELGGAIFHTTSDTEVIAYIITQERLRCDSIEQAIERAGSKGGNKGVEAAAAMLETIRVLEQL